MSFRAQRGISNVIPAQARIQRGREGKIMAIFPPSWQSWFKTSPFAPRKGARGMPHHSHQSSKRYHYTMIPLIADHSEELAEICRRHHVKRLEGLRISSRRRLQPPNQRHRLPSRLPPVPRTRQSRRILRTPRRPTATLRPQNRPRSRPRHRKPLLPKIRR